jgi:glycine/serine hydroxymethyltransferase
LPNTKCIRQAAKQRHRFRIVDVAAVQDGGFDTRPPLDRSGIRIGTPTLTTRGMREPEMRQVAAWIGEVLAYPAPANAL